MSKKDNKYYVLNIYDHNSLKEYDCFEDAEEYIHSQCGEHGWEAFAYQFVVFYGQQLFPNFEW